MKYFKTTDFQFPIDLEESSTYEEMQVLIRPEMLKIDATSQLVGRVENSVYHGSYIRYYIKVGKQRLLVDNYNAYDSEELSRGDYVGIRIPKKLHVIGKEEKVTRNPVNV